MSNDEESYEVIFDWKFESFNNNDSLFAVCSPVFVSNLMNSTSWKLSLHIHREDLDLCYYYFYLWCVSSNFEAIKIDCEVSIVDVNGSPIQKSENKNLIFCNKDFEAVSRFYGKDLLQLGKSQVLPLDTPTVHCRLRQSSFEPQKLIQPEFHLFRTRIERSCFLWTTEDFCRFQSGDSSNMHLVYDQSKIKMITFKLFYLSEFICVDVIQTEDCKNMCLSHLKISILDATGKVFESDNSSCPLLLKMFCTKNISKRNLVDDKNLYLPMGVLSLRVECVFSIHVNENHDENIKQMSYRDLYLVKDPIIRETSQSRNHVACQTNESELQKCVSSSHREFFQNLQHLYKDGSFSDMYILNRDCIFQAHKCILSARSKVFRDMLKEDGEDCIEIPDLNSDIVAKMLNFVYSDKVEQYLSWKDAMLLYFAAKKYSIIDLEQASYSVLKMKLCASNACEMLVQADLYEDKGLKSMAMRFIKRHRDEVMIGKGWNKFRKSHAQLAIELLLNCTK